MVTPMPVKTHAMAVVVVVVVVMVVVVVKGGSGERGEGAMRSTAIYFPMLLPFKILRWRWWP